VLLYANNELSELEIKKTLQQLQKWLGMNVTKEVKYLYRENYKTLMNDIEEDTKKWKDIWCAWIGINVRISVLPK
jgi:hypothetical protein